MERNEAQSSKEDKKEKKVAFSRFSPVIKALVVAPKYREMYNKYPNFSILL